MCDFKSKCATTPCHAEEADRLTKHLLSMHTVEAADSSTPLRSAQNDRAHLTSDLEVTHDVVFIDDISSTEAARESIGN